jgi:drug/metabolite transporter (DMT)-like permease
VLTYLLAVLAASANATASVLQRKANRDLAARERDLRRYARALLRDRVWLLGVAAIVAGFVLQASALSVGELSVVEPVLVLELPFTLLLASWAFRAPLYPREWTSIVGMSAGLAVLLHFLAPTPGQAAGVSSGGWLTAILATLALVGAAARLGLRARFRSGSRRSESLAAAAFGVAGGSLFGLTAALMKGALEMLPYGVVAVLTSWQLYAMVVCGLLAMVVLQSAMRAGQLLAAQPGLTLSEPVVSVLWGVFVFGERVSGGAALPLALLGAVAIGVSVVVLSRSPLLSTAAEGGRPDEG